MQRTQPLELTNHYLCFYFMLYVRQLCLIGAFGVKRQHQNHPHVAFAGTALGCAKTGAFAGLRRKGMRGFDCGGSAKQALL